MKKMFLMALLVALMAGLSTTTAYAQRGAAAKLRGDFGHGFWSHSSAPAYRSAMTFQATPVVESNRNFSYEPAAPVAPSTPKVAPSTEKAAPVQNNTTQRFSYEPVQMAPSYSYRSAQSHKPTWMYPKTDSRRWQH